jgi:tetratricopeptide (TPR) repeat protein
VTRRYKAFISYSWADKEWGAWVHRALETFRPPKGVADGQSLHPIFRDREEEAAGRGIGAAIEEALDQSEFLIVLCSPNSAKSQWVSREIAWFKTRRDPDRILALIVGGEPGDAAENCFPKALTHKIGADLQPTEELEDAPLAADARKEGDGKRRAKLKLAAAMLGVGLDDLVRRDERRRQVRRRWVTGAAFGLAGVLGGLSIFAFTQRDAAILARNDAVKARDDAEGLIELILTDLKSDLEGFGTLKSVTQIGNRAISYYEGQDVKALTPDQLGRRARVLLMLGEADNKRGDLTAALARYETAAATTKEQLARDPESPQRIFDHAQSIFWVGYIAWQRGDREMAKKQFTEYHDFAQRLVAKEPANEDWQAELDYAYSNLGTLALDAGDAAEAEAWFRKSLKIALAKLLAAPGDVESVAAAGQSYAWLADALHRQGKFQEARNARIEEFEVYQIEPDGGRNLNLMRLKGASLYRRSQVELAVGDLSQATILAAEAANIFQILHAADPESADIAEQLSRANSSYGECLALAGRYSEAEAALQIAIDVARRFAKLDPDVVRWEGTNLAQAYLALARTFSRTGRTSEAGELYDLIRTSLAATALDSNADPVIRRRYAESLAGLSMLPQQNADHWKLIIDLLKQAKISTPESKFLLAEAYSRQGDFEESESLIAELNSLNYRHPYFVEAVARIKLQAKLASQSLP